MATRSLHALVLVALAAVPDAGQPVTRTHEVRWLPVADAGFAVRVDAQHFKSGDREATIEVLTITTLDGGTTPALEKVNEALHGDEYDQGSTSRARACSTAPRSRTPSSKRGWRAASPVACRTSRCRCRSREGPSCREEVIARPKHAAFQRLCRARQADEAKAVRRRVAASGEVASGEWWDPMLAIHCQPHHLRDFTLTADGDLDFTVFRGPHVTGNFTFGFTLKKSELGAWADVHGPLGKSPR